MRKIKSGLILVGLLFHIITIIGCGDGRPSDMPPLQPVVLTFTLDEKPLPNAIVTLYSTESNFKWSVGGGTDENGQVVLMTNGRYAGVPEGKYKITVDKVVQNSPPIPKESELPEDEKQRQKIFNDIDKQTTITRIVDEKFLDEKKTPLELEVVKGKNKQTFDLGKPVNKALPVN
ncbi:MAG: carboxypeptidase-like regulatory domain-containing protein [Planctomycetaceae bacterium]|jgi:hypothetical protein|nr:carboxypeptidase-like regulatory domain-containing protein [Planctomycetaceae bacterium]